MSRARIIGICVLIIVGSSFAQEHGHGSGEKLGAVHFSTSCNEGAQKEFDQSVALLHSFQFSKAIQGFNAALKNDATCGIAYWGIALSRWSNPFAAGIKDTSQLQEGRESATTRQHDWRQDRARTGVHCRRCQVIQRLREHAATGAVD